MNRYSPTSAAVTPRVRTEASTPARSVAWGAGSSNLGGLLAGRALRHAARRPTGAVLVGDGHPPVAPEGLRRDAHPRRHLAALVLGPVDELDHTSDHRGIVALRDQVVGG